MYALAGNVKARARSSPALTGRSCVTDTRRSLRAANAGDFRLRGAGSFRRPALVVGVPASDRVEPDADRDDDQHGHEHADLERRSVEAGRRSHDGLGEETWPQGEDGRRQNVDEG